MVISVTFSEKKRLPFEDSLLLWKIYPKGRLKLLPTLVLHKIRVGGEIIRRKAPGEFQITSLNSFLMIISTWCHIDQVKILRRFARKT